MTMPYWSNGAATLYHADARAIPLPDRSVHCVHYFPAVLGFAGLWVGGMGGWGSGVRTPTPRFSS